MEINKKIKQTRANGGYGIDPANPTHIYMSGQGNWLVRYRVDYAAHSWDVDAVWPNVLAGGQDGLVKPMFARASDTMYLACARTLTVYRYDRTRDLWVRSAGLIRKTVDKKPADFFWNDANNSGGVDDDELRPTRVPGAVLTYHGQRWTPDLSYLAASQGGRDVWRLAPSSFDAHGNPVFDAWQKLLTDTVFEARAAGTADAVHGGNELADRFTSDWMQVDGSVDEGFYVQARGGRNYSANYGAQHKVTRYRPDGRGGYVLKWRVGRTTLGWGARRGELAGGMRLFRPVNGLLTVIDQSRSGLFLYTDEGMYVDTVFPPGSTREEIGVYRQPGEFFAGTVFTNSRNGRIYYGSGKYTPMIYEMQGWSLTRSPVRRLSTLPATILISAAQIANPPEEALSLRGAAGTTVVARFTPALGGVKPEELLDGWRPGDTMRFGTGKDQSVTVQGLYDPEHLYIRWHVRLGSVFVPKPLQPLERVFSHDRESDTVSLYFQGDVDAPPKGPSAGRPGDVRIVFGVFEDGGQAAPVAVGLYPRWDRAGAQPQIYRTPVGEAVFQHVGAVPGAILSHRVDEDRTGFVIAASIPRNAIPAVKAPFDGTFRTMVNFSANLGGHNKSWWANSDGSASVETFDEPSEARLYPGSWASAQFQAIADGYAVPAWLLVGPFGGPGAEEFNGDPQGRMKDRVRAFYEAATFPPDDGVVDPKAVYTGPMIAGYWKPNRQITWRPAGLQDMDTRAFVGYGAQLWYGATWIHAPEKMTLDFEFQNHVMTFLRWRLNDEQLDIPDKEYRDANNDNRCRVATRRVNLREGWNQVMFRGYNIGYYSFSAGLVVRTTPERLWKLRFSNRPPGA